MKNVMKCMAMALLLMCSVFAMGSTETKAQSESEKGDIVIRTEDDLLTFGGGKYGDCLGRVVRLANDIEMTGNVENWWNTFIFKGTFDGCGHTISNLHMCENGVSSAGFLSYTASPAIIKNLTIKDSSFYSEYHCGGIVGMAKKGLTQVINCHVINCQIEGDNGVGGIVGKSQMDSLGSGEVTVISCSNSGNGYVQGEKSTGGIVGSARCEVYNCANYGIVKSVQSQSGGIVGYSRGESIQNCINTGASGDSSIYFSDARGCSVDLFGVYCLEGVSPSLYGEDVSGIGNAVDVLVCDAATMRSQAFLNKLNANRPKDTNWLPWEFRAECAYPVLKKTINLSGAKATLTKSKMEYTGQEAKPAVVVTSGGKTLVQNRDYTVEYKNNIEIGTATVIIRGNGLYTGAIQRTFTITKAKQKIKCGNITYKGEPGQSFRIVAKLTKGDGRITYKAANSKVIKLSSNGYADIVRAGKVTVTIKAAGTEHYYKATKNITLTIKTAASIRKSKKTPARQKIVKVTKKGKRCVIYWKKNSKASGYKVQYSTSKNMKENVKTFKITNWRKCKLVTSALKKNRTYYIRVCSYRKVGGKTYKGAWSKIATYTR